MSLPPWISEKLDRDRVVNTKLSQQHVAETIYKSERPLFSLQQIQERVKPDVSKVTVRSRLNELEELGIVATETYSDSLTLYYIDHPESDWPLSPEGKRAIEEDPSRINPPIVSFLQRPRIQEVLREELLRSIAWAALGLFGWAILISSTDRLAANAWTVLGLPVLTWVSLTVGMIGFRISTGVDIQIQTKEGLHVVTLLGVVAGGFWTVFLISVLDWSLLFIGVYMLVVGSYLVYYMRVILPRFDPAGES